MRHLLASTRIMLSESLGNTSTFLQLSSTRYLRPEMCSMLDGRVVKLFSASSKDLKEGKQSISLGISPSRRLQPLKSNSVKEDSPENEGNRGRLEFRALLNVHISILQEICGLLLLT